MSKIYDVEKMYGQDFSIVTTNAPSNIIKQAKKLLSNTLLISSPQDENGLDSDNNMPAIFVTDYNAQPLQLTYPMCMINGLNYHENGYVYINIDNSTIKTENQNGAGKLKVETDNLSNATFNKKGVVKLSEQLTDINRNLKTDYNLQDSISGKYNNSTFITVNNDGILYLNNDLLDLINHLVDLKIKQKIDSIKIMLNSNLKMWIEITAINGSTYSNNIHSVGSLTDVVSINDSTATSLTFNLHYLSFNYEPESVEIVDSSNKVYSIEFENDEHHTIVESVKDNDELYQHTLNNISIIFLPNYFIENNENYKQELSLVFEIDNDKSETLIFQQNKLNGYSIEITTNSTEELVINEILNISNTNGISENIILNGFNKIMYDNKQIVKYQVDTFIVNNSDDSNNYELLIIDNYNIDNKSININNKISNTDVKSKLYTFIDGIIDKGDEDAENTDSTNKYEIDLNKSIQNNDQDFLISDFVDQKVIDGEIKYYVNLGTNFRIITDKNQEIGNYYKKIQIPLNINKKTIYGYIFIIDTNISNYSSNNYAPKHVYYLKRGQNNDGDQRIYVNNESGYTTTGNSFKINTLNLYCIYNDNDMSDDLFIPYQKFMQYDTVDGPKDFNDQIECIGNDLGEISTQDSKLKIQINNITNNILKMLYEGFTFNINYNQSSGNSIIKSQNVELKFNMLELLLTNMEFGYINNDSWVTRFNVQTPINILNTANYNSSDYYGMNNYVLTGYNNNKIENIKISLPECIRKLLSDINNKLYIHLYFYSNSNNNPGIQKLTITFNKQVNGQIQGQIEENEIFSIINNFSITKDNVSSDNNYIIVSKSSTGYLPKLLIIGYSISDRDEKTCYIQNTFSCNGGKIEQTVNGGSNSSKKLYIEDQNYSLPLYNIFGVTNDSQISQTEFIKSLLSKKSGNQSSNIEVYPLDLTGTSLEFNDGNVTNEDNAFKLLIDNTQEYYNSVFGNNYITKFKYKYLSNPNGILNNYNQYSKTPIDGGQKITQSGYQIRFNKIYFGLKEEPIHNSVTNIDTFGIDNLYCQVDNNNKSITIYYISISGDDNTLENFRTNILRKIFNLEINSSNIQDQFNYINLGGFNTPNSPITNNSNFLPLLLNDITINGLTLNNILLGYNIRYYHIYWSGLYGNNITSITISSTNYTTILNDTGFTAGNVTFPDQNNNLLEVKFKKIDNGQETGDFVNLDQGNNNIKEIIAGRFNDTLTSQEHLYYKPYVSINSVNIPLMSTQIEFTLDPSSTQYQNLTNSDLWFSNGSTQTSNITINDGATNTIVFEIYYNPSKISLGNNALSISNSTYQSDNPINISSGIEQDAENGMKVRKYSLNTESNYHNNTQYNITCVATGLESNGVNYANKTYQGTIYIGIPPKGTNPGFYFSSDSQLITSLPITEPETKLATLVLPTGKPASDVIYSVELQDYDSTLDDTTISLLGSAISSNNISFISQDKHIDQIDDVVKGKGLVTYQITATLKTDDQFLATSVVTYLRLNIPADPE